MDYFLFNFSGVQFHYTMSRRKTPEELRQAEAEKAAKAKLAKAEAAKKAAKDARVAAQQKRHAEMLAARTAK